MRRGTAFSPLQKSHVLGSRLFGSSGEQQSNASWYRRIVVECSNRNCDIYRLTIGAYDYDPTTTYLARLLPFDAIRREQKMNMSIFRHSRIAVESQL